MITEQELGKRIKKARKAIGISQKQLAEKAYISKGTLSYYEQGRTCPPALTLLSLCKILKISPNNMMQEKGYPKTLETKKIQCPECGEKAEETRKEYAWGGMLIVRCKQCGLSQKRKAEGPQIAWNQKGANDADEDD